MPKRIVDGEALWQSNKLLRVPEEYRAEYVNLIPLALANGSFECDARKIWSRIYVFNRPNVSLQAVEQMLNCFERAKMLFRWQVADGSTWGYWVGIDKPGRLPSGTNCKNAAKGQPVPADSLRTFISNGNRTMTGQQPDNDRRGLDWIGTGLGKDLCANPERSHESVSSLTTPKPPDESLLSVKRVWDYYIERLGKNPKLLSFTALRKQKGLARLGECLAKTEGQLERAEGLMRVAVDALAASSFHCGENDKKQKYDSWEANLFKNQEQLEKWLERT
jgi:hypothetical protein